MIPAASPLERHTTTAIPLVQQPRCKRNIADCYRTEATTTPTEIIPATTTAAREVQPTLLPMATSTRSEARLCAGECNCWWDVAGEEIVSEVLPLVAMLWKGDIGRYQNRPEFKSPHLGDICTYDFCITFARCCRVAAVSANPHKSWPAKSMDKKVIWPRTLLIKLFFTGSRMRVQIIDRGPQNCSSRFLACPTNFPSFSSLRRSPILAPQGNISSKVLQAIIRHQ